MFLSKILDKIESEVYNNIVPPGGQIVPTLYEKTTRTTWNLLLILTVFYNSYSNNLVVKKPSKELKSF